MLLGADVGDVNGLEVLRILRLSRIFRVLKFSKSISGVMVLARTVFKVTRRARDTPFRHSPPLTRAAGPRVCRRLRASACPTC